MQLHATGKNIWCKNKHFYIYHEFELNYKRNLMREIN